MDKVYNNKEIKEMFWFKFLIYPLMLLIFIVGCSGPASTQQSQEKYKDVALQYLNALSKGDFNIYKDLNWSIRNRLRELNNYKPEFDRQKQIDGYLAYERSQFNNLFIPGESGFGSVPWIIKRIKGAQLRVAEVGPVHHIGAGKAADVFIEAQAREKIIIVVPVVNSDSWWGVFGDIRLYK
jgi:hypothetical protein